MKQLYRSRQNKVFAGVCGGLGEYFNIDPTIIRILWVIGIFSGIGVVAYIVALFVMPEGVQNYNNGQEGNENSSNNHINFDNHNVNYIIGGALVVLGAILLGKQFFYWLDTKLVWAVLLIGLGVLVIYRGGRK